MQVRYMGDGRLVTRIYQKQRKMESSKRDGRGQTSDDVGVGSPSLRQRNEVRFSSPDVNIILVLLIKNR